jgi:hypothetical protein
MKRILAVALLLLSFASVAFGEGSGLPPQGQSGQGKPPAISLAG